MSAGVTFIFHFGRFQEHLNSRSKMAHLSLKRHTILYLCISSSVTVLSKEIVFPETKKTRKDDQKVGLITSLL